MQWRHLQLKAFCFNLFSWEFLNLSSCKRLSWIFFLSSLRSCPSSVSMENYISKPSFACSHPQPSRGQCWNGLFFFQVEIQLIHCTSVESHLISVYQQIGTSVFHTIQADGNLFYIHIPEVAVKAEKGSLEVWESIAFWNGMEPLWYLKYWSSILQKCREEYKDFFFLKLIPLF